MMRGFADPKFGGIDSMRPVTTLALLVVSTLLCSFTPADEFEGPQKKQATIEIDDVIVLAIQDDAKKDTKKPLQAKRLYLRRDHPQLRKSLTLRSDGKGQIKKQVQFRIIILDDKGNPKEYKLDTQRKSKAGVEDTQWYGL